MIIDGPAPGAWNMAVDEAVFKAVETGASPPTLRFYRWVPPAVSLGLGQIAARSVNQNVLAEEGIDLVRRPTGGKAVLHADEVTYSLCARHEAFPGEKDILDAYRVLAGAFAAGLARLGVVSDLVPRKKGSLRQKTVVCFAVPASYELLVAELKVLGSAQRRTRRGFLQHGSLPLALDLHLLYRCLHPDISAGPKEAHIGRWRKEMAGLSDAAGRPFDWDSVVAALSKGVQESFGVSLIKGRLSSEESALAKTLLDEKYSSSSWTFRR
jgi:lipoate-protein ligase A